MNNEINIINVGVDLDNTLINYDYFDYNSMKYKLKIKKSVKKFLPLLYKLGFRFHVITSRYDIEDAERTINRIECNIKFKFSSITCTSGEIKGIFAKKYNSLYKILDCVKYNIIPIHLYQKNKNFDFGLKNVIICKNWKEIYEYLIEHNNLTIK